MKRTSLSRMEDLIRRVVEEPFTWLSGGALDPFQLAAYLSRHYGNALVDEKQPVRFTVYINPVDFREIESRIPALERQVGDYVLLMAERRGHYLTNPPLVRFEMSEREKRGAANVVASHETNDNQMDTAIYSTEESDLTLEAIREADAFLVVQGRQHIPLDRPILRIGRRVENDIVLDAPSVSREHAQIRWRQPYFVLYDVSNHGRTSVNGARIREHILQPGDVIALSECLLIYGEGREEVAAAPALTADEKMDTTILKPEE